MAIHPSRMMHRLAPIPHREGQASAASPIPFQTLDSSTLEASPMALRPGCDNPGYPICRRGRLERVTCPAPSSRSIPSRSAGSTGKPQSSSSSPSPRAQIGHGSVQRSISVSTQRMDKWHGPGASCPASPPAGSLTAIQTCTKIKFRAGSIGGGGCMRQKCSQPVTGRPSSRRAVGIAHCEREKDQEMCRIPVRVSGCVTGLHEWTLCDWTA